MPLPAAVAPRLHWRRKRNSDRKKPLVSNVYQLATGIYTEVRAEFWGEAKALNPIKNLDINCGLQLQDLGNRHLKIHHSIQHASHAFLPG
jgi:hypothetical protein